MLGLMLNGSLAAVASVSHPGALLLTPSTPPASELLGEVLIDGSTSSAAQPRNATTVYCGAEIRVDGVAIKQSDLHGDIQVVRSWDQRLQTFSFSVVLKTPTGPLGSPFRKAGPATCVKTIDIDGILETPTGVHRVPLIRNGIVTSDGRSTGPGGHFETFAGYDAGGRYHRVPATLVLPPGHGTPRGYVVRALLRSMGVTVDRITPGKRCYKPVQATDADGLSLAEEILDTDGRRIMWDRDGAVITPFVGRPTDDERIAFTFDQFDFAADTDVSSEHHGEVITDVTLVGQQQDLVPSACDVEILPQETRERTTYKPVVQAYIQTPGGYAAQPWPGPLLHERLVRIELYERETRCGQVVWERKQVWGWKNLQIPRFEWDSAAGPEGSWVRQQNGTVYTMQGTDAVGDGFGLPVEEFLKLSEEESWHYYNREGFKLAADGSAQFGGVDPKQIHHLILPSSEVRSGDYLGTISRYSAIYAPKSYIKQRVGGGMLPVPWDDIEIENGLEVLGDLTAVEWDAGDPWWVQGMRGNAGEYLRPVGGAVVTHYGDQSGYLRKTIDSKFGWRIIPVTSGSYLYSDGREANTSAEQFGQTSRTEVSYLSTGSSSHMSSTSELNAVSADVKTTTVTGLSGHGPAIGHIDLGDTSPLAGDDGSEQAAARYEDQREIKIRLYAANLELCHLKGPHKGQAPWAEDEEDLLRMARMIIEDSAAADFNGRLAGPNFFVEPCDRLDVEVPSIDLDSDRVRVRRVSYTINAERVTVDVEGKVYGW